MHVSDINKTGLALLALEEILAFVTWPVLVAGGEFDVG